MPWKQIGRRILKGLGWLIGGVLALVATLYVTLLLINLRDQPPSEFALRLESIHRNRPVVADADNGYIYVLGFTVPPDADPHEMGLRRVAWLRHLAEHTEDRTASDPLPADQQYQPPEAPAFKRIREACAWGANDCDIALAESDAALPEWLAAEQWRVDRYRKLLTRSGWLETLSPDPSTPWPAYSPVLDAQRMLLAEAHYLAGRKDADGVREILEQDVRFWRATLRDSDILISRMIAVAALSRHFSMGNLVLRRLPPEMQLAAMPEAWRTALTADELSWHRCVAGEWTYGSSILRQTVAEPPATSEWVENPGFVFKLLNLALRPLFQLQDTHNQRAEMFVRAADVLQVPIEQFQGARDAAAKIFESQADRMGTFENLYNPIGDIVSSIGSGSFAVYPPRVADVEGARRAAVLATELRSRKVTIANVPAEIGASDIRAPYTGAPLDWDSKAQAILFTGLVPGERGQHSFKY